MAEQTTEHLNVAASIDRCIETILDFERYPEWAPDIKAAIVIDRDEQGRGRRVAYRAAAMGRSASYLLSYSYSESSDVISWTLVEGDIMRGLEGSYRFVEQPDSSTDVTYHLSVELVVPIPGFVKRRAEGKIISTALRELRFRLEVAIGG
jgi:uncharacterized membrane protein